MPNRGYQGSGYRYGFNGKENDDEVKGVKGSQQDYGFRIYDPRLGRFLSVDPLTSGYPWYTPYQFAGNKPIWCIDLDGLEEVFVNTFTFHGIPYLRTYNYVKAENRAQGHTADGRMEYAEKKREGEAPTWYYTTKGASSRDGFAPSDVKPISQSESGNIQSTASQLQASKSLNPIAEIVVPAEIKAQFSVNATSTAAMNASLTDVNKSEVDMVAVALLKFDNLKITIEGSASSSGNAAKNKILAEKRAGTLNDAIIQTLTRVGATADQIASVKSRITITTTTATGTNDASDQSATIKLEGGQAALKEAITNTMEGQ